MKKRLIAIMLVTALVLPLGGCNQRDLPQEGTETKQKQTVVEIDYAEVPEDSKTAGMNFAVQLFQNSVEKTDETGENTLISPTSVLVAMAMTSNGAKGDTLTQLEETLGMDKEQLNTYVSAYLASLPEDEKNKLSMANSIWYTDDERFTVNQDFLQKVENYYQADVKKSAFDNSTVEEINEWVENETNGMVKDIMTEIPPEAVMYLVNALAFEAEWEEVYDETQIREGIFTLENGLEQNAEFMYSEENLYLEDEMATGFIKYYEGQKYAFVALLPKEGITVSEYVKAMSGESLQALLTNPTEVHVDAYLPMYQLEYYEIMNESLMEMGITDAFNSSTADLTGLGTSTHGNIWIDRVIHKTFIQVGPQGTKAGAATIVEAVDECAPYYEEGKEVRLDRPFIYMIIDCETNQPLFMGTLNYIYPYRCGTPCIIID